jgi:hypothetical protein
MNTRMLRILSGAALTLMAIVPVASAAAPTHGALYIGQHKTKKIALRVSSSGKHYLARLYCAGHGSGAISGTITHGKFSGHESSGSTLLWSIKGSFASKETAHVSLHVHALCDGVGGHLTLTPTQ